MYPSIPTITPKNSIILSEEIVKLLAETDALKSRLSALYSLLIGALRRIEGAFEIVSAHESNLRIRQNEDL